MNSVKVAGLRREEKGEERREERGGEKREEGRGERRERKRQKTATVRKELPRGSLQDWRKG